MRSLVVASALVLLVPASAAAVVAIDAVRPLAPSGKRPARVVVQATDSAGRPVTSVRVVSAGGTFAESACGVTPSGEYARPAGRFEVPIAGGGDAVVTVGTGGCAPDAPPAETTSEVHRLEIPELAAAMPPAPQRPSAPPPPTAATAGGCKNADVEVRGRTRKIVRKAIHCLVHARRRAAGARRLRTSPRLQKAAAGHALDMRRRAFFAHTGPDGPDLAGRLERVGFWPATAGENLAAGTGALVTARAIVDAWMGSATHRANMLDKRFEYIGIGIEPTFPNPPTSPGATVAAEFGRR